MGRYSSRYDRDGIPVSMFGGMTEPKAVIVLASSESGPKQQGDFDDADRLYEDLRDKGLSHKAARTEVARKYGV